MSRKIDRSKPTTPPWWFELHAAMDSPTVDTERVRDRAKTKRSYNPKRPAMKQPKQRRPLPQGWTEVNALSLRRSMRKANRIMATELAPFLAKG
jgi:hypothetical protein